MSTASELNLTVVVPAYNEGENVTPVVREIVDTIAASPWVGPYEVVLVNDGSTDNTGAVMDGLARELPQLRVFHHPVNRGFGAGLRTGFTNSRGKVVCFITADGEIGIDQALRLVKEIGDHDLLQSGRERNVGADRKFLTWGVDLMMRLILGFEYRRAGRHLHHPRRRGSPHPALFRNRPGQPRSDSLLPGSQAEDRQVGDHTRAAAAERRVQGHQSADHSAHAVGDVEAALTRPSPAQGGRADMKRKSSAPRRVSASKARGASSPRVALVPITVGDAPALFDWINDRELVLFNSSYRPVHESSHREWVKSLSQRRDLVAFGIRVRSSKQLIGVAS